LGAEEFVDPVEGEVDVDLVSEAGRSEEREEAGELRLGREEDEREGKRGERADRPSSSEPE